MDRYWLPLSKKNPLFALLHSTTDPEDHFEVPVKKFKFATSIG
jgi:hypothetical protein